MDYKEIVVQKLRTHVDRAASLPQLEDRIKELRAKKGNTSAPVTDGVLRRGGSSKIEDRYISDMATMAELERNYRIASGEVDRVNRALQALDDTERRVLSALCIQHRKNAIFDVCEELCYERSHIYRIRDRAIRRMALRMYGLIEV